ncbi:hypothetical protein [Roseixanthobacter liquoris]
MKREIHADCVFNPFSLWDVAFHFRSCDVGALLLRRIIDDM